MFFSFAALSALVAAAVATPIARSTCAATYTGNLAILDSRDTTGSATPLGITPVRLEGGVPILQKGTMGRVNVNVCLTSGDWSVACVQVSPAVDRT